MGGLYDPSLFDSSALVQRGVGAAAAGVQDYGEKNRTVHPAIDSFLKEVLAGRMSGKEAGIRAQLAIQGGAGGSGAPSSPPSAPPQSMVASGGLHPGVSAPMTMAPGSEGGLSPQAMAMAQQAPTPLMPSAGGVGAAPPPAPTAPTASSPVNPTDRPFTAEDLGDFNKVAPFIRAETPRNAQGLSLEDRIKMIEAKGAEDRQTGTERDKTKTNIADANRTETSAYHKAAISLGYARITAEEGMLNQKLENATQLMSMRVGADQKIAALNAFVGDSRVYEQGLDSLLTSLNAMADDPSAIAEIKNKLDIAKTKRERAEQMAQQVATEMKSGGPPPSTTITTRTKAGSSNTQGNTVRAPPLPTKSTLKPGRYVDKAGIAWIVDAQGNKTKE